MLGQISTTQLNGTRMIKLFNPIINAVPFLLISPDSKQGGMGEVGAATEPDVNSAYWNGSKLAFIDKRYGVGATLTPWLRHLVPDINMIYLSGFAKINSRLLLGSSIRYFSLGKIDLINNQGIHTGT